jgi:energy-coupling factor transport system permease protein
MAFSGLYIHRESIIHRLDARVKIAWFLLALVASIACQWDGSVSLFIYISLIAGLAIARIPIKRALLVIIYSIVFFVVTILVWASMYQNVGEVIAVVPLTGIRLTDVGLLVGTGKFFLIVNPITAFLLLITTTRMYDIQQVLNGLGIPYKFLFMFSLALGLLPATFNEIRSVVDVQKSRGIEVDSRNPVKRIVYSASIFIPVVIRMMSYVWDLSIVLYARGFGLSAKRTYYFELRWSRRDTIALIILTLIYGSITAAKLIGFSTYYWLRGLR